MLCREGEQAIEHRELMAVRLRPVRAGVAQRTQVTRMRFQGSIHRRDAMSSGIPVAAACVEAT